MNVLLTKMDIRYYKNESLKLKRYLDKIYHHTIIPFEKIEKKVPREKEHVEEPC